ncbi:OmpA family protein [Maribacter sp. ACAM166]|uniref:OmpA family protein n=1 Tax=Maribacter sp. ACAM166 TaxID=2508996 RepID=UPI0010FDD133|nr:OmpA family protein [Maribacter sp. ACAM166]TLP74407.1 OmpA family protein [Maribacter sp. ACAM166]
MKITKKCNSLLVVVLLTLAFANPVQSQFIKKLGKAAERAAKRTVERRVENETSKKTDAALDSILEPGTKNENKLPIPTGEENKGKPSSEENSQVDNKAESINSSIPKSLAIYSKFDFVPGDKQLFFDDFSNDFVGDFPAKWNTNGGGELVNIEETNSKWLKILPGYNTSYIPDVIDLPEEFTFEFDVITDGLNQKTSSTAHLQIMVGDNNTFDKPKNYGFIEYPLCQFIARDIIIENNINGKREIRSGVAGDIRQTVLEPHHISVAVNKQRFRFWINEGKFVDVPRLLPSNITMRAIKLSISGTDINEENLYISNFKVKKGGLDLRQKLLADGKISTNGILFDSGSANIQPQSMGIILQISQVLKQESSMNLKIVGHTDADGEESANMTLSKNRAEAVKRTLVNVYGIDSNRLTSDGKGESVPVGDNGSLDGKAQNRRVEFIKQ